MLTLRPSAERGSARIDWLDTRYSFSFADYHDPTHMGFRSLRVINEDIVAPGAGFDMHGHRDMEIITYILSGALAHKDSTGSSGTIKPGQVQFMSAGKGVMHSEFNASQSEPVHLLQIWILPAVRGLAPRYEERDFPLETRADQLKLVVSPDGQAGSIRISQDARIYAGLLQAGKRLEHSADAQRHCWLQVARGTLDINSITLQAGDGAALSSESALKLAAKSDAEFLLFDLN